MPAQDVARQQDHRRDLRLGEIGIAEVVAGIDDLDADGARVDVALPFPGRDPGMPGAPQLRHALNRAAILEHHIVRRDLARRLAQLGERGLPVGHAGVVQHQHVRAAGAQPTVMVG
jgi:hypothetical protein